MPRFRVFPLCLILLGLYACTKKSPQGFQLSVALRNANSGVCLLYRLPLDGSPVLVDSFKTTRLDEDFVLRDKGPSGEYLYQLFLVAANTSLYFISDAPRAQVTINAVVPQAYSVSGSAGSQALQALQLARKLLVDSLYILNNKIRNQLGDEAALVQQANELNRRLNEELYYFSDTVSAPLVALFTAQQVDFSGDVDRHRAFAGRMESRFSAYPPIQAYISKLKDYFSLLEIEFEPGDTLPNAIFQDIQGREVSTVLQKGKYCLLEFWASYCPQCLQSLEQKRGLYAEWKSSGFEIFAFSLDEDRALFESKIATRPYPWPVIADFKGWSGKAAQTYKIDSIPYNFLLGPDGRIIQKNISSVELTRLISRIK